MSTWSFVALALVACGSSKSEPVREHGPTGPTVLVRPIPDAPHVALVVLYGIGGDHDPPGKSGLAHLVEHLYVTAAAGDARPRAIDAYVARYPDGWNAQTGDRYTVIATVFPRARLEDELRDAAARMSSLVPTQADVDRERGRVIEELDNMYAQMPALAARNLARERVRPAAVGRKGGVPDEVRAITLVDVTGWSARYYRANNAVVVLAGDIEETSARAAIARAFSSAPRGEPVPLPLAGPPPRLGAPTTVELHGSTPQVCAAWRAPPPDDPHYAAFLVLFGRLVRETPGMFGWPIFDDPDVITGCAPVTTTTDAAIRTLDDAVARTARGTGGHEVGRAMLFDDALASQNVYGAAFTLGRMHQLGIDRGKLRAAFDAVDDAQVESAAAWLAPAQRATVLIR